MKMYRLILLGLILSSTISLAQNTFYLRAISEEYNPELFKSQREIIYNGTDRGMKKIFSKNRIKVFRDAFVNSQKSELKRTWVVESDSKTALSDFLEYTSHIFEFGELIETPTLSSSYPNDYGVTSPVVNLGIPVDLSYFDFIGVPDAWDYTTGSSNMRVGIIDGGITSGDSDFTNQIITNGVLSNNSTNLSHLSHGNSISMILAGEGNNGGGSTGICQNCEIVVHYYLSSPELTLYEKIEDLAINGARIINCSLELSYSSTGEALINEVTDNLDVIVVASSGNGQGETLRYPASFDNVISVGGVGSGKEFIWENVVEPVGSQVYYTIKNLKHALGGNIGFRNDGGPPTASNFQDKAFVLGGRAKLNDKVDILAPGAGVFSYGRYLSNGNISYTHEPNFQTFTTSAPASMVSGTIALMLDLNGCLNLNKIESILKTSSTYISEFKFNRNSGFNYFWADKHDSGTLNTGRAIKLVNDLKDPLEVAYIENQKFSRWNFEFEGVSQHIEIRNQEFTEASTLSVITKNGILIEEGSLLEPNNDGDILLDIDSSLVLDTNCISNNRNSTKTKDEKTSDDFEEARYSIAPTLVKNEMSITERFKGIDGLVSIQILDLMNRDVYSRKGLVFSTRKELTFNLQSLIRGIYIVKGYSSTGEVVLTEKIIKL